MACLLNYTIQCKDITSGSVGCFLFDTEHWKNTGEFKAISKVYNNLDEFYKSTTQEQRKSCYIERINHV